MPTAEDVRVALQNLLDEAGVGETVVEDEDEGDIYLDDILSFDEAGILTMDQGLVLRFSDGSEYQVTVKRSR